MGKLLVQLYDGEQTLLPPLGVMLSDTFEQSPGNIPGYLLCCENDSLVLISASITHSCLYKY